MKTANHTTLRTALLLGAILLLAAGTASAQFAVSGTVRDNTSAPVSGVGIRLYDNAGNPIGIPPLQTDAAGFYAINGLPNGGYVLQFDPPVATRLLAVQQPATVSGGNATLNVNLQAGFLLSGHVTDENGVGIGSIDLQVVDRDTGEQVLTPGDDTDITGFYDVVVPEGEFDLEWRSVAPGGLPWIPVTMREVIDQDTVIDVTMVVGHYVSGTVRDAAGMPVAGVNMDFVDAATGVKLDTPGDNTNALGFYQVQVPVGEYVVRAKPAVATRLVPGEMTGVVITGDLPGVDFTLVQGVLVSGRVTAAAGGGGVAGADVDARDAATGASIFLAGDTADLQGFYQVVVPAGELELTFEPPLGVLLVPHRTAPTLFSADTTLNVPLAAGVALSGVVRNNVGAGLAGVDIDAIDTASGVSVPLVGDDTSATGTFSVVVAPGTYHLEFEPPAVMGLVAERRLDQVIGGATSVTVTLQPGARVTGTVTDPGGLPVADVDVDALTLPGLGEVFTPADRTNALGQYEVIIPAGTYRMVFQPSAASAPLDTLQVDDVVVAGDVVLNVQLVNGGQVAAPDDLPGRDLVAGLGNHPNPFNPATVIRFDLARAATVSLGVYDVTGRRVADLVRGDLAAGPHTVAWQGRDAAGRVLPSGVYVYRLTADGEVRSGKMLLTK